MDELLLRIESLRLRGVSWNRIASVCGTRGNALQRWARARRRARQRESIESRLLRSLPLLESSHGAVDVARGAEPAPVGGPAVGHRVVRMIRRTEKAVRTSV